MTAEDTILQFEDCGKMQKTSNYHIYRFRSLTYQSETKKKTQSLFNNIIH